MQAKFVSTSTSLEAYTRCARLDACYEKYDGSSFMWHQPCQRCKYTTSVDIQKRAIKSYTFAV